MVIIDGAFIVPTIISSISAIAAAAAVFVTLRIHHQDSLPSIVLYLCDDHDKGAVELVLANVGRVWLGMSTSRPSMNMLGESNFEVVSLSELAARNANSGQ